jgi:hypothetical protein
MNRCQVPNCRLKTLVPCRCTLYVCSVHKFEHGCAYDYKSENLKKLQKDNPKIVADKVDKL